MRYSENGFLERCIVKQLYDEFIRKYLPRKFIVFNSVPVAEFGRELYSTNEFRNYKEENISALRRHVEPGDDVVVVGGGFGHSSVVAARKRGDDGVVTVYEADSERINNLEETVRVNRVDHICKINNAIVGQAIEVENINDVDIIPTSDMPDCDLLEMDCEGAEGEIIDNLTIHPRIISLETHPEKGPSTESLKSRLTKLGYTSLSSEQDPVDGHILVAELDSHPLIIYMKLSLYRPQ